MIPRRHREIAALLLLAALYLGFPNARPDFNRYNSDDGGMYAALAESLAHGRGYTLFQAPLSIPHAVWPPVFPALLSVVVFLFGAKLLALKLAMAVLGLIGLVCTYAYFERARRTPYAATIVLVTGLSPLYFAFSHYTMADLPVAIPVMLSLWSITEWARVEFRVGTREFWAAGLCVACATLVKPQALALVVCPVAAAWAHRRQFPWLQTAGRLAAFAFLALTPLALWFLHSYTVESAGYTQSSQLYADSTFHATSSLHLAEAFSDLDGGLVRRTVMTLRWALPYTLAEAAWPIVNTFDLRTVPWPRGSAFLFAVALLIPVAVGFVRELRDGEWIATTFFVAHTGLVMLTPSWATPRLFVAVVPLAVFYALRGFESVFRSNAVASVVSKGFVGAAAIALTLHLVEQQRRPFPNPVWAHFDETLRWSAVHLPPTATVLTHNWADFHLASGLIAFPISSPAGATAADWQAAAEGRVIFLVMPNRARLAKFELARKIPERLDTWVTNNANAIELVFQNDYYRVYKVPFMPLDALGVNRRGAPDSVLGGP